MASSDKSCLYFIKTNLLVILTLIGVIVGFAIGISVRELHPSADALMWIGILGELYLNVIKMMIVPLVASSIISGTASLDPKFNGKISLVGISFILITNFFGTVLGTVLCVVINPGGRSSKLGPVSAAKTNIQTQDVFADLLRNILPENLVAATFQVTMTKYEIGDRIVNTTMNGTHSQDVINFIKSKKLGTSNSVNMLGILVISSFFGMATAATGKIGRPFYKFFYAATEIVLVILEKILWSTPIGVASLIMREVAGADDLQGNFMRLGIFIGTFMLGQIIALFIVLPIIYVVIVRRNPLKFFTSLAEPMLIVLATTLTSIAMPESLRKLEGPYNKIDKRITRFIVPLNAAIGRTGSCIFLSASCVFISQLENQDQNAGSIVLIVLLVTLMSFAVPSIPSGSLVTIIILLSAIGIPPEAASLLFAFDWFSDRMRSITNIYFQCLTSAVTYKVCKSSLRLIYDNEKAGLNDDIEGETIIPLVDKNYTEQIETRAEFISV
ncbi:excitatory amino acid transporter 1-like isoform X1 [Mytilus californianus]|uniref:excitatory amino acid transporter 1-like isoform X1 n=1 Tax=Mytilus californianus TaxID=6549 RepID=UPI002248375C|nr:excitatory amino acid transporter 1-like isoform X1 [Mytilus californianus]